MARPKSTTTSLIEAPVSQTMLADTSQAANAMAVITDGMTVDQLKFTAHIGARLARRNQAALFQKFATVTDLIDLQQLKESKAYRGMMVLGFDGKSQRITTFAQYCEVVEGRSVEAVDLDLRNLKAFGAEFMEMAQQQGLGYREMRELRTVPADERTELLEVAKTGNRDAFVDLAEAMISKHQREQSVAAKKLDDAKKTLEARQRLLDEKNAENDALKLAANALRDAPLPEQEAAQMDTLRADTLAAEGALQRLLATVDQTMAAPATEATEKAARHSLDYLVQRIVDGCMQRGIAVDLADRVTPIYMQPILEAVDKFHEEQAAKKEARKAERAARNNAR